MVESQKTGIGFFEAGITSALLQEHGNQHVLLQYFSTGGGSDKSKKLSPFIKMGGIDAPNRQLHYKLYRLISTVLPIPYSLFFKEQADITHFFNFIVPPGVKGKKIAVVHDMSYDAFPETVRWKTKTMLRLNLKRACRRADKIMTISEFSKLEIVRVTGMNPKHVVVVPCGVDQNVFHPAAKQEAVEAVKRKYGLPNKYFLYLGTLEPRKNIERMLVAYAELLKRKTNVPILALAGRKGWMYTSIFERTKALGLEEHVRFLGYIEDAETPFLLCGAHAFFFPSLYEGFGMPVLEAMACGTPVLTSNVSSLPEVTGSAAILVDPLDIGAICDGMELLLENDELRFRLRREGIERAQMFTWARSATKVMEIYRELVGDA